jgi:hypothetical protein
MGHLEFVNPDTPDFDRDWSAWTRRARIAIPVKTVFVALSISVDISLSDRNSTRPERNDRPNVNGINDGVRQSDFNALGVCVYTVDACC